MGATLVGLLMIFGTLDLAEINRAQGGLLWGWLPKWGDLPAAARIRALRDGRDGRDKRIPFDLPEGESEIVGYFLEYSSMKFGAFFMARFHRDDPDCRADHDPVFRRVADSLSVLGRIPSPVGVLLTLAASPHRGAPVRRLRRQSLFLLLVPAFDPLDTAAFPLRPAHAARLEVHAAHLRA